MSRGPDAATLLERAILADARTSAVTVRVVTATATRWASATFAGERHAMSLEGERSAAADRWLGGLGEADLPMRGHLVADLVVIRTERSGERFTAMLEVLTLEGR